MVPIHPGDNEPRLRKVVVLACYYSVLYWVMTALMALVLDGTHELTGTFFGWVAGMVVTKGLWDAGRRSVAAVGIGVLIVVGFLSSFLVQTLYNRNILCDVWTASGLGAIVGLGNGMAITTIWIIARRLGRKAPPPPANIA